MIFDDGDDETPWERTVTVCCARLAAKRARQYIDRRDYNREAPGGNGFYKEPYR